MIKERPVLPNLTNSKTTGTEKFQNEVLRPIIKMHNDLLIAFFIDYLNKRKIIFSDLSDAKKKAKIKSILERDLNLKNKIIGIIIGSFSLEEFHSYTKKASEFNKRMIQIISQRLQSKASFINL